MKPSYCSLSRAKVNKIFNITKNIRKKIKDDISSCL